MAGDDADLRIQELYGRRSDLVVVCVSSSYNDRPWTQLEHRAIRALTMRVGCESSQVLPLRFGDGEIAGLLENAIAPDVRGRANEHIAALIVARLEQVPERVAHEPRPRSKPPIEIDVECSFHKGSRNGSEKPALMTLGASARLENQEATRIELAIGFPRHSVPVGFLDQEAVAIGCTGAQLRITNQTGNFSSWHDSTEDSATRLSSSALEWHLQKPLHGAEARILVGNRTLWATFPRQSQVLLKTSARPIDRRVFDAEGHPLGIQGSLALLAKLIATGTSLPHAENLEESITVCERRDEAAN